MQYLFFDTAVNGYYTLLILKKECQNWLPLLSKEENISDDAAPFLFEITDENLKRFLSTEHISFKEILFVESNETMTAVRDYFSRFAVQTIKGRPFYFRFWAANVFVKYIATCNVKQLSDFFKTVAKFSCREEGKMVAFSFDGKKLVTERTPNPSEFSINNRELPDTTVSINKVVTKEDNALEKRKAPRRFF